MQTAPANVSTLHLRTMRPGETYLEYTKRMRGVDAMDQLNRTFQEKRLEIATEAAHSKGFLEGRTEGTQRGLRLGHMQGFWWGFVCGGCCAAVVGALSVVGRDWLTRGPLL